MAVSVMGKRMFDLGEKAWPEEAPFHTPVVVVTHEKRDPWQRLGGTTFHFLNDGIETALDQARGAAGRAYSSGPQCILRASGLASKFVVLISPSRQSYGNQPKGFAVARLRWRRASSALATVELRKPARNLGP
jgi:dihydrofolate reductase